MIMYATSTCRQIMLQILLELNWSQPTPAPGHKFPSVQWLSLRIMSVVSLICWLIKTTIWNWFKSLYIVSCWDWIVRSAGAEVKESQDTTSSLIAISMHSYSPTHTFSVCSLRYVLNSCFLVILQFLLYTYLPSVLQEPPKLS